MARKKKKASSKGKKSGRPAVLSLGRSKKGAIRGKKTRVGGRARKVTAGAKSGKRSYR